MQIPFHPMIVHLPLALSFILPILVLIFAVMIKKHKMSQQAWAIIIGLQVLLTATGYVSLESGEEAEVVVEKVIDKKLIHEHEEKAEVFVGSTVLALVLSIAAYFLRKEIQFLVMLCVALLGFLSSFLAYRTGYSGGELVYRYGAAQAYQDVQGKMMIPGNESPNDKTEGLKVDENDYGHSEDSKELDDEIIFEE